MGKKVDFRNPLLGHTQSPEPSVCSNQKQTYVHKTPPHSPCVFTLPGNKPDCYHFYPAVPFNVWLRHWTHWALRAAIHKKKTFFFISMWNIWSICYICETWPQHVQYDRHMGCFTFKVGNKNQCRPCGTTIWEKNTTDLSLSAGLSSWDLVKGKQTEAFSQQNTALVLSKNKPVYTKELLLTIARKQMLKRSDTHFTIWLCHWTPRAS